MKYAIPVIALILTGCQPFSLKSSVALEYGEHKEVYTETKTKTVASENDDVELPELPDFLKRD